MEHFLRLQINLPERAPENFRVGFIRAQFARDENVREQPGKIQVAENESQTSVEIGNHGELKTRLQRPQHVGRVRIQLPHARLGEMSVGNLEEIIPIQFTQGRGNLVEHKIDQLPPPVSIVVL